MMRKPKTLFSFFFSRASSITTVFLLGEAVVVAIAISIVENASQTPVTPVTLVTSLLSG